MAHKKPRFVVTNAPVFQIELNKEDGLETITVDRDAPSKVKMGVFVVYVSRGDVTSILVMSQPHEVEGQEQG